jgi:hypothetical protein
MPKARVWSLTLEGSCIEAVLYRCGDGILGVLSQINLPKSVVFDIRIVPPLTHLLKEAYA